MAESQFSKSPKHQPERNLSEAQKAPRARRPVAIIDPLLPHTHRAQGMKPYAGAVPSYVATMDAYAHSAGLNARRLYQRPNEILLVYSGTREQIKKCELVKNPGATRWPATPKASLFTSARLAPHRGTHGNVHRLAEPLYAITLSVALPLASSLPCKGVECFDFYGNERRSRWGPVAYYGTREALIAGGVCDADMLPEDGTEMHITQERVTGCAAVLEESVRLHGDAWAYLKYPGAARMLEEEERAEAEKGLSDQSPEEWLEEMEDWICRATRAACSPEFCSVDTKSGMRYTINPANLEAITNDIEAVAQRIRNIPVKVQSLVPKSTPENRGKVTAAASDGKFQSFMQVVISTKKSPRGKS